MSTLTATEDQRTYTPEPVGVLLSMFSKPVRAIADWLLGPAIPVRASDRSAVLNVPLITCCGGGISSRLWDLLIKDEATAQAHSMQGEANNV